MADLIDRISGESVGMTPSRPKLPVHQFTGGLRLYCYGLKTRVQVATNFDLQGTEATQAGALADRIDAQTGIAVKIAYALRIEAVAMLMEQDNDTFYHNPDGTINKTAVLADLGI